MTRKRKENRGRANRKRTIRKRGQVRCKKIPHSVHTRAKQKTMFNCFNLEIQGTLVSCILVSPRF